ncbi:hypothetical protein F441_22167, partial [Phytophthora nicotianae CJ01A1]
MRGNIPHLNNNTNNRLEASWGAAKDILDRQMPMDECIDDLLFLQQNAEDKYRIKTSEDDEETSGGDDTPKGTHGNVVED